MNINARHIFVVALLAAGAVGYFVYDYFLTQSFVDRPRAGTNIIAFGDSLVEGVGASTENNFVSVLSYRTGLPIINAGKSGDTTSLAKVRLERDVLSKDPKVVILLLGGNDALRGVPPEETFSNLSFIIDRIHEKGAGVLLVGVRGGILNDRYQQEFQKLASEKKVSYVSDVLRGILGRSDAMSDAIHPNDIGYAMMADRLEGSLRKMLQ